MAVSELATSWGKMAARSSAGKWTSGTAASSPQFRAGEVFAAYPDAELDLTPLCS